MNKYPLGRILLVRELREEQAQRVLRLKLAAVEAAKENLAAKRQAAAECRAHKRARENEMLRATIGVKLDTGKTRSWQREIDSWRAKVEAADKDVEVAETQVRAAQEACDQARAVYQAKMKDKYKLSNHKEMWQATADKEAEAAAEAELEETRPGAKSAP